jgi:TPR repeat protein
MSEETKTPSLTPAERFLSWKEKYQQRKCGVKDFIEQLKIECESGSGDAYAILGNIYITYPNSDHQDNHYIPKYAIELFNKGCELKSLYAYVSLADYYSQRCNSIDEKKLTIAVEYYKKACELKYLPAFSGLGKLYISNMYNMFEDSCELAKETFEQGCSIGDDSSFYWLGILYFDGMYLEQNKNKGLELLFKASDLGNRSAKDFIKNKEFMSTIYEQRQEIARLNKTIDDIKKAILASHATGNENLVVANAVQYM